MEAYIKSVSDFSTLIQRPALDWDLCLDSASAEKSSVSLAASDVSRKRNGDWLILNEGVWLISNVSASGGVTKLELQLPEDAFSRPRFYSAPGSGATVGSFIAAQLEAGWRYETDAAYAMPYLRAVSYDSHAFVAPELDANGMFSLTDYMRSMRRLYGVYTVFSVEGGLLRATVRASVPGTYVIVPDDGHTKLKTSSFAAKIAAKITTVQPVEGGSPNVTDWYLSASGGISSSPPVQRASGSWEILPVGANDDASAKAAAQFAKNKQTYKLEFWSDLELRVLDDFTLILDAENVASSVESVWRKRGEQRKLYKSGQQAKTLTEKVRETERRTV